MYEAEFYNETCPHCEHENELVDVPKDVFKIKCKHCGQEIMLCSKCYLIDGMCDWRKTETGGKCFRGETIFYEKEEHTEK